MLVDVVLVSGAVQYVAGNRGCCRAGDTLVETEAVVRPGDPVVAGDLDHIAAEPITGGHITEVAVEILYLLGEGRNDGAKLRTGDRKPDCRYRRDNCWSCSEKPRCSLTLHTTRLKIHRRAVRVTGYVPDMGPGAQMAVGAAVAAGHGDNILFSGKVSASYCFMPKKKHGDENRDESPAVD